MLTFDLKLRVTDDNNYYDADFLMWEVKNFLENTLGCNVVNAESKELTKSENGDTLE